jgi:membrane protein implicated in regulation of membrane protease activity
MGLDIRLPIGMMFSLLGALLVIYGVITGSNSGMYQSSLGININFWWGLVLFAFGVVMLIFALRARAKPNQQA